MTDQPITRERLDGDFKPVLDFIEVEGSIKKAAEKLGVTPSGLSTAVSRGSCSVPLSKLAKLLLETSENDDDNRHRLYAVSVPVRHEHAMRLMLEAVRNIKFMRMDDI